MTCLLQLRFVLPQVLLQLLEGLLLHAGTAAGSCVPLSRLCAVDTAGAACLQVHHTKAQKSDVCSLAQATWDPTQGGWGTGCDGEAMHA